MSTKSHKNHHRRHQSQHSATARRKSYPRNGDTPTKVASSSIHGAPSRNNDASAGYPSQRYSAAKSRHADNVNLMSRPSAQAHHDRGSKQRRNTTPRRATIKDPGRPPKGFVFVPKGDVFVTRKCTTLSTESGTPAQVVCDPHTGTRLGLYVHQPIHATVLAAASASAAPRAAARARRDAADLRQARTALQARYASMPDRDVDAVLARAFAKHSGNVGRKKAGLSEARRVSLAVEAHVRHVHTRYDAFLREGVGREEARRRIGGVVRGVKEGWRGKVGKRVVGQVGMEKAEVKKAGVKKAELDLVEVEEVEDVEMEDVEIEG
ncbi:MAG: hypothetical protein M1822_008466 [Bathelium mastoideum]|nr:MAG: hypothetical protein M1822_008466 [Bathelium mastoideum]